jgi:hypothetical protein
LQGSIWSSVASLLVADRWGRWLRHPKVVDELSRAEDDCQGKSLGVVTGDDEGVAVERDPAHGGVLDDLGLLSALPLPKDIIRWAGLVVLVLLGVAMMFPPVQDLFERPFSRLGRGQVSADHGGCARVALVYQSSPSSTRLLMRTTRPRSRATGTSRQAAWAS